MDGKGDQNTELQKVYHHVKVRQVKLPGPLRSSFLYYLTCCYGSPVLVMFLGPIFLPRQDCADLSIVCPCKKRSEY